MDAMHDVLISLNYKNFYKTRYMDSLSKYNLVAYEHTCSFAQVTCSCK